MHLLSYTDRRRMHAYELIPPILAVQGRSYMRSCTCRGQTQIHKRCSTSRRPTLRGYNNGATDLNRSKQNGTKPCMQRHGIHQRRKTCAGISCNLSAVVSVQLRLRVWPLSRGLAAPAGAPAGLLRPRGPRAQGSYIPHRRLPDELRPPLLQHVGQNHRLQAFLQGHLTPRAAHARGVRAEVRGAQGLRCTLVPSPRP